ncbi:MAG: endonuclease III [Ardenticatenaceae bacterium]|nr:endonuclease III [Ardenticatenaceae bacterium]MCB9446097.1 endonuclease III [Ardenticatenaceae bacterium]
MTIKTASTPEQKYTAVHQALIETYGEPAWRQHLPPVDELVSTILSQSTSDINRDKGFYALKERYPDWESVINAPEKEIIETIRSAGLANQKGPRIQEALHYVQTERGEIGLDFLQDLPLDEAKTWLTNIKGVGPKTAAIILLFAFGRPAFPVDTHVHRITQRLGLIGPKVTADKAHAILENIGNPDTFYPLHLNLIRHGRETCTARNPKCMVCPLQMYCYYYQAGQHAS